MYINYPLFAGVVAVAITAYALSRVLYNLYLHPLARFPGPVLHRATRFTFLYKYLRGTLHFDVLALHQRYGPVVRIAPDELAFSAPDAWRDIYGHKTVEFSKYENFYRSVIMPKSVIVEPRESHGPLRRQMSGGFSDRSMREQEGLIGGYVDLLMGQLADRARERRAVDLMDWYTWATFDIVGDLVFGEPFGSLKRGEEDPWVKSVSAFLAIYQWFQLIKHLGLEGLFAPVFKLLISSSKAHAQRTEEMLRRRMKLKESRPDLIQGLLDMKDEWNIDFTRLSGNANALLVAGSETTATLLSGVTYLLLRNPDALSKVTAEVRSTFASEKDITLTSVGSLTYMFACLNEAMRVYPPVPGGFPRVTPKGGDVMVAGEVVPEMTVVAVWQWATYHSDDNFTNPFEYHPERFLGDPRFVNDKNEALQPFSVGPRNCVGRTLAYAEMRLILARFLYNFDMHLVDEKQDWFAQTAGLVWVKNPLKVNLTLVER